MIFTLNTRRCDDFKRHCILKEVSLKIPTLSVNKEVHNVTHNQVAYWDSIYRARNQAESNRIEEELGTRQNEIREFEALRNEYWTHKNYNWNESMFGYQLFKDFSGELFKLAIFGM